MSKQRDWVLVCAKCRAKTEVCTDLNGKLREIPGVCTCKGEDESLLGGPLQNVCETEGCGNPCRLYFCLECSSERQAANERNRHGDKPSAPLPKCGWCGKQLNHPLSRTCSDCKRRLNAERTQRQRDEGRAA